MRNYYQSNRLLYRVAITFIILFFTLLQQSCQKNENHNLYTFQPRTWYEDKMSADALISPDGKHLAITNEYEVSIYNLETGLGTNLSDSLKIEWAWAAHWGDNGDVVVFQSVTNDKFSPMAYNVYKGEKVDPKGRILNATRDNSKGDNVIVYNGRQGIWLKDTSQAKAELMVPDVHSLALVLSPNEEEIAFLIQDETGYMELKVCDRKNKTIRTIRDNLDATYQRQRICYTPDGGHILISLASDITPVLERKYEPNTNRNLKIYAISTKTGALTLLVDQKGDNHIVGMLENELLWRNFSTSMKTGIFPLDGGEIKPLLGEQSSLAYWHPEGIKISVMYGDWHLADWALNWDLGTVDVDKNGNPTSELKPEITGFHEDYALIWSPDSKWQAFHSHRSQTPVSKFGAVGSTDDIWLKSSSGGKEIRLTDFGAETAAPDWAPDSKRLVFCSIGKSGYKPWIITIDPISGQAQSVVAFDVKEIKGGVNHASWSPTHNEFALEETVSKTNRRLWLVGEDGSNPRSIVEYEAVPELGGTDFTPDGNFILYSALSDGHQQIFRIDRNGENRKQLTFGSEEAIWPQVSPDGHWVSCTVYTHTNTVFTKPLPDLGE